MRQTKQFKRMVVGKMIFFSANQEILVLRLFEKCYSHHKRRLVLPESALRRGAWLILRSAVETVNIEFCFTWKFY